MVNQAVRMAVAEFSTLTDSIIHHAGLVSLNKKSLARLHLLITGISTIQTIDGIIWLLDHSALSSH